MKEDLNRHIPQKINEFASLALAGRYPQLVDKCQIVHHHNKCACEPISGPHSQVLAPQERVGEIPWREVAYFLSKSISSPRPLKKYCALTKKCLHQLLFFHQFQSKCAGDDSSWSQCHMHHCHSTQPDLRHFAVFGGNIWRMFWSHRYVHNCSTYTYVRQTGQSIKQII